MVKTIISRREALALGLTSYFTGKPCVNGHIAERRTLRRHCRKCIVVSGNKYRAKNPELQKQKRAEWAKKNGDKIHANKVRNRDKTRAAARKRYVENKEEYKENAKLWRKANPLKLRLMSTRRRARMRGNGGRHTESQIKLLLEKQNGKCMNCLCCIRKSYTVDHVMPLALGGSNGIENIQLLCRICNCTKSATHPDDWARMNGRLL